MRILHIIASVDPRGGGPIEGIIRQSAQRIHDQVNLATLDQPGDPWVASCPVHVVPLGSSTVPRHPWLKRLIPWLRYGYSPHLSPWLKRNIKGYDLIVINGLWNYSAWAAARVLIGSGRPYVVFTHGMLDPWFRRAYPIKHIAKQLMWWLCDGRLLANATAVLFTSADEKSRAEGSFWPYRVPGKVVGYGTTDIPNRPFEQTAAFQAIAPATVGRRYLLFLSRIHPKKGCDILIRSFVRLAKSEPDLDLVIAGPDLLNLRCELEKEAASLGIADRIHWTGMLSGEAKWGAFRGCDAFVLPSHQENFGIVVAEALAAGKPVLISDKVNIWREIEAAGAGLVATDDQRGVDDLFARFVGLGIERRQAMSRAARSCFLERFEITVASASIFEAMRHATQAVEGTRDA